MSTRGPSMIARLVVRTGRTGLLVLVALLAVALLAPAGAFATVVPFATAPPVPGAGGGTGELWPWGYGFVTNQGGSVWGDDVSDTFQVLTRDTTYMSAETTAGGARSFVAFIDKNPALYKPYLKLKKNGVYVANLESHVQTRARNYPTITPPGYTSENGTWFPGNYDAWFVPITAVPLDPGCAYEFSFLRGIRSNNTMTGVIYTDVLSNDLGWIQQNGTLTFPDENSQYTAKQFDTYRFHNPYNGLSEDFLFRFQTYADTTAFEWALANAIPALATATANQGSGPGQIDPAVVAALQSAVDSATAVPLSTMRERLQPAVDAAAAELVSLNPYAPPTTTVSGIPATWTVTPVTFSLEASGDAPPFDTYYALGASAVTTYTAPVLVSAQGTTTVSYFSVDAIDQAEATKTATILIDSVKPTSTVSGLPAGGVASGTVTFSLAATDAASGIKKISYVLDSSPTTSTYSVPVVVSAPGTHTLVWWALDNAGNKESAHNASFRISAGAPVTSVSGIPGTWSTSPVTFSLVATGDTPPISSFYALGAGAVTPYGAPVLVSTQGTTTLSYFSVDAIGQTEATKTATILVDTIAPVTTSDVQATYSGSATIHLTASDGANGSGVAHTYYRLDGGGQTEGSLITTSATGAHTLEFWSVDVAGNTETPHKTASFVVAFTITASAGANGAISPSGVQVVGPGANATFTITPNSSYHIADVLVDGVSVGAVGNYTFTNVTANHTIAASFAVDTFTITPTAGAHGSITPSGVQTVASGGSSPLFVFTPDTGYHVSDVVVDGISLGERASFQFTNVTSNHTISASFAADVDYTITASAGAGGSISPSGAQVLDAGATATYTITPNSGYHIADVLVDGASVGAVGTYTFANVAADHTIAASFAISGDVLAPVSSDNHAATYATSPALVKLTSTDEVGGSGMAALFYRVDGGATVTVNPSTIVAASGVGAAVTPELGIPATHNPAAPTDCACHALIPATHSAGQTPASCACHVIEAPTAPVDVPNSHAGRIAGNCNGCHPAAGVIRPVSASNPNHYGSTAGYPGAGECGACHTFNVLAVPPAPSSISTTVTVSGTGAHTIEYWGQDVAGNTETPHKTASFTIGGGLIPTTITIRSLASATYIGRTVRLDGRVTPESMIGRNIVVYVMKPNKSVLDLLVQPYGLHLRRLARVVDVPVLLQARDAPRLLQVQGTLSRPWLRVIGRVCAV